MLIDKNIYGSFKPKMIPFDHQTEVFERSKLLREFGLFMEQGTGKSKVIVDNFVWLFLEQEIDGVFITTDKAFYLNWFYNEIPDHMPEGINYRIHYWDSDWTEKERKRAWEVLTPIDNVLDIFIMNIEALTLKRGFWFAQQFIKMLVS